MNIFDNCNNNEATERTTYEASAEALRTSKCGTWLATIFILVGTPESWVVIPHAVEALVHLACFAIRSVPYFEYVESKANWSDEISREGAQGTWAPRNAFPVEGCGVVVELLTLPSPAVVKIFEYL